ncbi:redoxin domain-containing protein [Celeribacter persicus]|jgi:AhpC/TSA family.|uniref:AhpC/TSA family protein n=1 Tax=Celeribacter persicus TaxID=1651082 RepID=A0A2T5HPQ0_9RHOB|nr:redoxin domain-containing protein [Celeribacter persicus]PTQ73534.1 AhpC/TSA family protein [Celeribacter persicus]
MTLNSTRTLIPGKPASALRFTTFRHGICDIAEDAPAGGTLVAFHRGSHCKWSRLQLKELDDRIGDFAIRGLRVFAVGCETQAETAALQERMQLIRLPLGYGLDPETLARDWGLYLTRNSSEEGAASLHIEPAQVWIKADGTIGLASVQSGPNLWPDATNLVRAIDNTMKFPERGQG